MVEASGQWPVPPNYRTRHITESGHQQSPSQAGMSLLSLLLHRTGSKLSLRFIKPVLEHVLRHKFKHVSSHMLKHVPLYCFSGTLRSLFMHMLGHVPKHMPVRYMYVRLSKCADDFFCAKVREFQQISIRDKTEIHQSMEPLLQIWHINTDDWVEVTAMLIRRKAGKALPPSASW